MFTICINRPGFLPEMEPYNVTSIDEAREALRDELERAADGMADGTPATGYDEALAAVDEIPETGGHVDFDDYVYEITPAQAEGPEVIQETRNYSGIAYPFDLPTPEATTLVEAGVQLVERFEDETVLVLHVQADRQFVVPEENFDRAPVVIAV